MNASPHLLMFDALLGLVERQLDQRPGNPIPDLRLLGEQLQRLLALHVRLAETTAAFGPSRQRDAVTAPMIRAILNARRLRTEHLGPDIADAAWALILTLYEARLDRRTLSLTRLGETAAVPPSTANRWVHTLCERRMFTREGHPQDQRLALIGLTDEAAERVETCLKATLRLSPRTFGAFP